MREIISNQPEKWQGRHLLMCTHSFNSKSKILYLMYCDIIKEMPNRRLKIKVYGDRHVSICGEKIRYGDAHRVVDAKDYNVKKIEREKHGAQTTGTGTASI